MKKNANKNRHIGCSGFYYPSWKNQFYPEGIPSSEWLGYYSSVFNSLEINSTFYRQPQLAVLKRYADTVPNDFTFAVKMSRYFTHVRKLIHCAEEIEIFQDKVYSGLQDKLGAFLFQLPAAFRYTAENLEHVLGNIPSGPQNVVEFRDKSWWNHDVREALERQNITFCNVDYPGLIVNFQMSTDVFYLRLHGNPDLFKSRYQISELERFEKNIPDSAVEHFIFFNNTYFDAGFINAREMMEIVQNANRKEHA